MIGVKTKSLSLLLISLMLCSCGSFVERMHHKLDIEEGYYQRPQNQASSQFNQFKSDPHNYQGHPTTATTSSVEPKVKRQYREVGDQPRKRYTAEDLVDNSSSNGSLWAGAEADGFLFSQERSRNLGDLVVIEVQGKLKNDITAELKRVFPPRAKKEDKSKTEDNKEEVAAADDMVVNSEDSPLKENDVIYDKFTSIIVEEINNKHILVKAQKNILYNKRKHLVEVQALINRADITTEDTILSNKFLETTIQVLR